MPQISLNLKQAGALGNGKYRTQVTKSELQQSKAGNPMWYMELTILEPEDFRNRKLFWNGSLLPQALWNTAGALAAMGHAPEELESQDFIFDPDTYMGYIVDVTTEVETYEGRDRDRVVKFEPAGDAVPA